MTLKLFEIHRGIGNYRGHAGQSKVCLCVDAMKKIHEVERPLIRANHENLACLTKCRGTVFDTTSICGANENRSQRSSRIKARTEYDSKIGRAAYIFNEFESFRTMKLKSLLQAEYPL